MKASDERRTPRKVFDRLHRLFYFTLDPCTSACNPLGLAKFYTAETDGLAHSWEGEHVFVNPPYSQMDAWAQKACREASLNDHTFVAFILPNDCTTRAWKWLARSSWGRWEIPYRVKFETPEGKKVDVARGHVVFFLGVL